MLHLNGFDFFASIQLRLRVSVGRYVFIG